MNTPDPSLKAGTKQILLVEDNPADVTLVRESLREHQIDAQLKVITDGEKALEYLQRLGPAECPDLVLLDINLPKKNGFELLTFFRENVSCPCPVVVVSSSSAPEHKQRAEKLGAQKYWRKPTHYFEFLDLGRLIRELLTPA